MLAVTARPSTAAFPVPAPAPSVEPSCYSKNSTARIWLDGLCIQCSPSHPHPFRSLLKRRLSREAILTSNKRATPLCSATFHTHKLPFSTSGFIFLYGTNCCLVECIYLSIYCLGSSTRSETIFFFAAALFPVPSSYSINIC